MPQAATPGRHAALDAGAGGCSGAMEASGHPPGEGSPEEEPSEENDEAGADAAAPSEVLALLFEEGRDVLDDDGRVSVHMTKRLKVGWCRLTVSNPC